MNYRQPISTSTVQIVAEPANKISKSRVARSSPIVKEAIYTAVQSGNHSMVQRRRKKKKAKLGFGQIFHCFWEWGGWGERGMLLGVVLYKAEEQQIGSWAQHCERGVSTVCFWTSCIVELCGLQTMLPTRRQTRRAGALLFFFLLFCFF